MRTAKDIDVGAIRIFAKSCEVINEFARGLREYGVFDSVKTGADIRDYESGWRLEKYVEAVVVPDEGFVAAWWLELGERGGRWVVESNVSVSHTEIGLTLPERTAPDILSLERILKETVDELTSTAHQEHSFMKELLKLKEY